MTNIIKLSENKVPTIFKDLQLQDLNCFLSENESFEVFGIKNNKTVNLTKDFVGLINNNNDGGGQCTAGKPLKELNQLNLDSAYYKRQYNCAYDNIEKTETIKIF